MVRCTWFVCLFVSFFLDCIKFQQSLAILLYIFNASIVCVIIEKSITKSQQGPFNGNGRKTVVSQASERSKNGSTNLQ